MRGREGGQRGAGPRHGGNARKVIEAHPPAGRVVKLGDQRAVSHARGVAMAELPGEARMVEHPLEGGKARLDVVAVPACPRLGAGQPLDPGQNAKVRDRMHLAGKREGQGADMGARLLALGQERRGGAGLLEIFEDRERLRQQMAIDRQRRHQPLRIDPQMGGGALCAGDQIDQHPGEGHALQPERDPHPVRGRGPPVVVENDIGDRDLHRHRQAFAGVIRPVQGPKPMR
ncbi:hypothetical protein SDC9_29833 [bioreactor metagenome]|uniref:Uncharacterized protein n=1 Tax=bioreactor metagenome TaxID=1076179 RepID=A0A644UY64_9ZZZZ